LFVKNFFGVEEAKATVIKLLKEHGFDMTSVKFPALETSTEKGTPQEEVERLKGRICGAVVGAFPRRNCSACGIAVCSGARPPPVLHTCQTSREVGLSVFEPAWTRDGHLVPVYIDLTHDILYLAADLELCKRMASFFPD